MVNWLITALRNHVEIAFFLTLAIGYLLGRLRVGHFSLGAVTGTLLAGVLVAGALEQLARESAVRYRYAWLALGLVALAWLPQRRPDLHRGLRIAVPYRRGATGRA